jgi:hypothetical protein
MTVALVCVIASTLVTTVVCLSKRQSPRCGTATVDLTPLKAATDYVLPAGSPCSLPQCYQGKLMWSVYFNFCQPVQISGPVVAKCAGASACQQWPGDSASLGQFSMATYTDVPNGVIMSATGGTPDSGISRQMVLNITCGPAPGDPYPAFTNEDSSSLTYSFAWSRPEVCVKSTPAPTAQSCDGKSCLTAIEYCMSAVGPTNACMCFSKGSSCFQNCTAQDVSLLQAELACFRAGCGCGNPSNCTF